MARKTTATLDQPGGGFRCPVCPKVLARQGDMPRHMKTHSVDKEDLMHRCPYPNCNFKNLQKKNVETHMRIHTGQKSEICPDCEFKTTDPGSLTRHRKRFHSYVPQQRRPRQPTPRSVPQASALIPPPVTRFPSLNELQSRHDADRGSLSTRSVSPPWGSPQSFQHFADLDFGSPYLSGQSSRSLTDSYLSSTSSSPVDRLPIVLPPLRPVSPDSPFYNASSGTSQASHTQPDLPLLANTLPPIRTVLAEAQGRSPFEESRFLPPLVNVGQVPRPNLPPFDQYINFTAYPVLVSAPSLSTDTFNRKNLSQKTSPPTSAMLLPDLESNESTRIFLKEVEPSLLASPDAYIVKKTLMHPSQIIWFWDSSLRRFWSPNAKVVLPAIEVGKPLIHPYELVKDIMLNDERDDGDVVTCTAEMDECISIFLQNVSPLNKAVEVDSGVVLPDINPDGPLIDESHRPSTPEMDERISIFLQNVSALNKVDSGAVLPDTNPDGPPIDEPHRPTLTSEANGEAILDTPSTPIRNPQVNVGPESSQLLSPPDMDLLGSFIANTTQEEFQTMTCELCGMDPGLRISEPFDEQ